MQTVIRQMQKKDASAVYAISQACHLGTWSLQSYEQESENPVAYYAVAEADKAIAGFAGIWCVADEAQVMIVGVLPEYRGKGLGEALMRAMIAQSLQVGCTSMTLEVKDGNEPAIRLYQKLGFATEGVRKNYYSDHSDGFLMRRLAVE